MALACGYCFLIAKYWPRASQLVAAASWAVFIKANSRSTDAVPLERSAFPDRPSHVAGHRFDLFILTNGRLNPIGFQMGIEGFGMLFDQIRALLVRVVRAGAKKQAGTKRHPIAPQHRVVTSHDLEPLSNGTIVALILPIDPENPTVLPKGLVTRRS